MRYRVIDGDRGIEVDGQRVEPGEQIELTDDDAAWLLAKGLVEVAPVAARRSVKTASVEDGE